MGNMHPSINTFKFGHIWISVPELLEESGKKEGINVLILLTKV